MNSPMGRWLGWFSQDARLGVRRLREAPGFAAIVIVTLALGLGASTALFSVVDAVLLRPLPFAQDGSLVMLYASNPDKSIPRCALGATRLLDAWLFGVGRTDLATFGGVAAGLMLTALAACYAPARRATKVDPLVVMRGD